MKSAFATFAWAATAAALCCVLTLTKGATVLFLLLCACLAWCAFSYLSEYHRDAELRKLDRQLKRQTAHFKSGKPQPVNSRLETSVGPLVASPESTVRFPIGQLGRIDYEPMELGAEL